MLETSKSLVVGFSCNSKKRQSFFQPFGDYLARKGHILQELDLEDVHSIPCCDVVIHKRTDDMAAASFQGDSLASCRIKLLQTILEYNQNHVIIDNLEAVWSVVSRQKVLQLIDEIVLTVQRYHGKDSLYSLERLEWFQISNKANWFESISFPVIIKTLPACGIHKSHIMCIVWNDQALKEVLNTCFAEEETVIAQQLVSSAYIFKVYVIGDYVDIFCQPNLPLLKEHKSQGWLCFDSQEKSNEILTCIETSPMIDSLRHFIQPWIPIISQVLRLSLYGLDIVLDIVEKRYYIVDINYFPSFRQVENCWDKMWSMIEKRLVVWQQQ